MLFGSATGLGLAALSQLSEASGATGGLPTLPHHAPRAKRIIYLFQSGGPSQIDLFGGGRQLESMHAGELPPSVRGKQRLTGMTSGQDSLPIVAPMWGGRRAGPQGTWISDLLPNMRDIAGEFTFVRSMHTEAINHDPAVTFINTGSQQMGHASLGAWLSYGLGCETRDLPAYMVLLSQGSGKNPGQPLFSRLWGSGYLPSDHQGVMLRAGGDPVLYLNNPPGVTRADRREQLDTLASLNRMSHGRDGDPETRTRIEAYEMAYRMQVSVPQLADLSDEPESTFELYGDDARRPGTFAANCLMARRMAERGVRFIQLFHRGWDQHIAISDQLPRQCRDVDRASAALVTDLKRLGMLDDTIVVWGGEFGRTVYSQGEIGSPGAGRDHHGRCFTTLVAGGGFKSGYEHGVPDEFEYNVAENPVHIRDLNATLLHQMGIDHERLTFKHRGLSQRPTGVEPARVVREILA